jgi:predicted oxidoreductase
MESRLRFLQERHSANAPIEKLLATLVSKYHLGSDTILLSWVLKQAKVIPIAGTINVARIQSLMKAVDLELEKEDWFAIGQKAWAKMP